MIWLLLSLCACELKVVVEYPGETGLDSGADTGEDAPGGRKEAGGGARQGRLGAARRGDDGDEFARGDVEIEGASATVSRAPLP